MHGQAGDDFLPLHGFMPLGFVYRRSGRSRWSAGLRPNNVDGAVEPRPFARAALLPGRMLRHKITSAEKTKSTTYCRDCDNRRSRLHVQDLFVAELAVIDRMRPGDAGLPRAATGILPARGTLLASR